MEEVKKQVIPKKPTIKELYLAASGQEVGMDYFLYTCFEEEKTCASLVGKHLKINNKKKYPGLREGGALAEDIDQALADLFQWYHERYSQLAGSATLDYAVHSEMLAPFIALLADAQDLFRKKSQPLPRMLPGGTTVEQEPNWAKVLEQLQGHFPHYYKFMAAYITWITKAAAAAPIDLTSVPPVGRYLQLLHEARRKAERKANQGNYAEQRPQYSGDARPSSGRGDSRSSSSSSSSRPTSSSRDTRDRHPHSEGEAPNEEALRHVEQGIAKLKKNMLLKEVILKPQNSYIRHEQHRKAEELGFTSDSTGEGATRAVKITRASKKEKK